MSYAGLVMIGLTLVAKVALATDDINVVTARIPFSFVVENTTMPSGRYRVERAIETDLNAWVIRSMDSNGHSVAFLTNSAVRGPNADAPRYELIFTKIGDQHFLTEVWTEAEGYHVVPSRTMLRAEVREQSRENVPVRGER